MESDGQDSRVTPVDIVVESGDANSGVNTTESPAAGNGSNGEHLVDAEEFENTRMVIGTLGKSFLDISLSDNLTGTRHIDIRVRRNNRAQSGGGVAAGQAVGPGKEAPQGQAPAPPDSDSAAAAQSRRLKITVAADEPEPKPDADAKALDKMRGWLMTVATLFVGITYQAAMQPPQWAMGTLQGRSKGANSLASGGPATAPSPTSSAHQQAATNKMTDGEAGRAATYLSSNGGAFVLAVSLLLVLVLARRGTPAAGRAMNIVKFLTPCLCVVVGFTFVVAMSINWWMTAIFLVVYVVYGTFMTVYMLGKLGSCMKLLRRLFCR